jgi:hypothetical protein
MGIIVRKCCWNSCKLSHLNSFQKTTSIDSRMRAKKALPTLCLIFQGEVSWEDETGKTAMVLHTMPQEFCVAIAS